MVYEIIEYVKKNIILTSVSFILLCISVFEFVYFNVMKSNCDSDINNAEENISLNDKKDDEDKKVDGEEYIYVDIKGEVNKPNVYYVKVGSRVNDLIKEAGGLTKNANTRFINLSKKMEDGEVIVIYSNKEINDAKKNSLLEVSAPCVCEEVKNDACYNDNDNNTNNNSSNKKVNINTASQSELTSLNGIGEAKAKAIINYRNTNGKFKTINDIKNVTGISDALFSKIKENITV